MKSSTLSWMLTTVVMLCITAPFAVQAQDNKAQAEFDAIFSERIQDALKTNTKDDDTSLASEMISYLEYEDLSDDLKTIMAFTAFNLTLGNEDKNDLSNQALQALQLLSPEKALEAKEKYLEHEVGMLRSAPVAEREERTERVYEELMSYAELLVANAKPEKASEIYLQAMTLARNLDKEQMDAARDARAQLKDFIAAKAKLNTKVDEYKRSGSKDLAREIALGFLLVFNQPRSAQPYAEKSGDEELISAIKVSLIRDLSTVDVKQLISVGSWYETQAANAPEPSQRGVYERALNMLETAVNTEGLGELDKLRANVKLTKVKKALQELPETEAATSIARGNDADANENNDDEVKFTKGKIRLTDQLKDFIDEQKPADWIYRGRSLVRRQHAERIPLVLDVTPGSNYSLRFLVTTDKPGGGVELSLPVNKDYFVPISIVCGGKNYAQAHENGLSKLHGRIDAADRRTAVVALVKIRGENVGVELEINGKTVSNWSGKIEGLPRRGNAPLSIMSVDTEANLRIDTPTFSGEYLEEE